MHKKLCFILLTLACLHHPVLAIKVEHSIGSSFSRYRSKTYSINGLCFAYKLAAQDTLKHKLGFELFYCRLPYRDTGTTVVFRDRLYFYGAYLLKPYTPYNKAFELEISPALGLVIRGTKRTVLTEPDDTLYYWIEGSRSPDPVCFSTSLDIDIKRPVYKNNLGIALGAQAQYYLPVIGDRLDSRILTYGYGIRFGIFYRP